MTQDLNKMFEMAKKQEKIALALEEAEKTLDVKAFRKAIALFDELGVKIVNKYGFEQLKEIAKLNFKNTIRIKEKANLK